MATAQSRLIEALSKELEQAKAGTHHRQKSEEKRLSALKAARIREAEHVRNVRIESITKQFEVVQGEAQEEFERSRSVFERALDVDYRSQSLWLKYAEMEMRNKFLNHARDGRRPRKRPFGASRPRRASGRARASSRNERAPRPGTSRSGRRAAEPTRRNPASPQATSWTGP